LYITEPTRKQKKKSTGQKKETTGRAQRCLSCFPGYQNEHQELQEVAKEDYYLDLLFYNIPSKCYIVIKLKNTKVMPKYAGKLNFYLSAVECLLRKTDDKPTIGMLLRRDKNSIAVEKCFKRYE
jgi:hypothetical protein